MVGDTAVQLLSAAMCGFFSRVLAGAGASVAKCCQRRSRVAGVCGCARLILPQCSHTHGTDTGRLSYAMDLAATPLAIPQSAVKD